MSYPSTDDPRLALRWLAQARRGLVVAQVLLLALAVVGSPVRVPYAPLVALLAEAAQMQGAVLGCLNEQSAHTEEGEETSSEWALAAAAALVEWRPTLESSDQALVVPIGEVIRDSADEAAVDSGAGVGDLHSAARRRDAVPDVEAETRVVAGLSHNAAMMRRRLERRGLEGPSDGRLVGAKLTAKASVLTVAKLLAFLLLNAVVVSGVGVGYT